ncbi:hypothetical protein AB1Y20_023494 [Prymnesium parvum]|uniref:Methyltransferase FkbM domain-containing protein n=1 Tax=Prymnesium parvum TaxID=97485 RepID=A0AB34JH74_PRYPA
MLYGRSQWGEDRTLLPLLLDATKGGPGVFVELGALDGDTYSNTIMLERCFNWTGVLIEANPFNFAKLRNSGRRAALVHSAVCVGIPSISMTLQGGPAAGDVRKLSKRQKRHFNLNQTVTIPCKSLVDIMADAGFHSAQFLSLDVEGAEDLVLEAADPSAFDLVMVETEGKTNGTKQRVHTLLSQAGLQPLRGLAVQLELHGPGKFGLANLQTMQPICTR